MRSTDESQPRRSSGISYLEVFMVLGLAGTMVVGAAAYYGRQSDQLLAVGTDRLVATLSNTPMNEACPEQALGAVPNCRMFGDYRVRQTHDDSWTISRRAVDGRTSDVELVLVSGGKLYPSKAVARQMMSARFEAIEGVVGKSAAAIAAEKG